MKRRTFIQLTGLGMVSQLVDQHPTRALDGDLIAKLIKNNDIRVHELLSRQELSTDHKWYGGVKNAYDIHTAGETADGTPAAVVCVVWQSGTHDARARACAPQ